MKLDCTTCDKQYDIFDSDALSKLHYCSRICELRAEQKLPAK